MRAIPSRSRRLLRQVGRRPPEAARLKSDSVLHPHGPTSRRPLRRLGEHVPARRILPTLARIEHVQPGRGEAYTFTSARRGSESHPLCAMPRSCTTRRARVRPPPDVLPARDEGRDTQTTRTICGGTQPGIRTSLAQAHARSPWRCAHPPDLIVSSQAASPSPMPCGMFLMRSSPPAYSIRRASLAPLAALRPPSWPASSPSTLAPSADASHVEEAQYRPARPTARTPPTPLRSRDTHGSRRTSERPSWIPVPLDLETKASPLWTLGSRRAIADTSSKTSCMRRARPLNEQLESCRWIAVHGRLLVARIDPRRSLGYQLSPSTSTRCHRQESGPFERCRDDRW
ncbi:hypothetical protein B0H10DRAFT_1424537 [Mycena sp. CBHHK59/15]|nr:hypothetical protein B0H10DRAFT_1424537 [Mycena sp. CBHHK59/15]